MMAQDQGSIRRKTNCILVNPNQKGNKLLKFIRNSPWEFSQEVSPAHYLMSPSTCALFLSLKYHIVYPDYIYKQLNELGNYQLKVLIVLMDHIEYVSSLKELTKVAIRSSCTLMLAWTPEEAASFLDNYKSLSEKSPEIIMGKQTSGNSDPDIYQCLVEALCTIKSVNKTDAVSLISLFDSFEKIVNADQMAICPGMGLQKAERVRELFNRPFKRAN